MDITNVDQSMPKDLFQVLTKVPVDSLSEGDILKGRIQSLENGILLIKLSDGNTFTAAVPEGFSANVGELITLEIGQRLNNQLTAKIINIESNTENRANMQDSLINTIGIYLKALGVAKNDDLISNIREQLISNPKLTPNQATFLEANKLSQTPHMDEILLKITEHEFSLHENLQNLQNGISETLLKMDGQSAAKLLTPTIISQGLDELSNKIRGLLPETSHKLADSIVHNLKSLLTKTLMNEFPEAESADMADLTRFGKNAIEALMKSLIANTIDVDTADGALADGKSENNIQSNKEGFSIPPETADFILNEINKALSEINAKREIINTGEEERFANELKAILEKLFDKAFIKVENGIIEDINIKEKAEALKDIMYLSQRVINNTDKGQREMNLQVFNEIDTAFKFFEQITTYNSFLQLPIKMNQENTTGELYVMKRKHGRSSIDIDNFTLLLSITTKNLGAVESFLNATNSRISISFRLEDEELVKLFNENYMTLYDGLIEKGFVLVDMKCKLLNKDKMNILNANTRVNGVLGTQNRLDFKV